MSSTFESDRSASDGNLLPGVPLVESPLFYRLLNNWDLTQSERETAIQLHERGYAVIDFPDQEFNARSERLRSNLASRFPIDFTDPKSSKTLGDMRVQDAWQFDPDVQAIAANSEILLLLSKLYGRRAFPFQTLNFPVGTQQTAHSDSNHFSSQPERFMCGVWVALEDIHLDAGPLLYYPGSHKWPIVSNAMIGRRGWQSSSRSAQAPFEEVWSAMVDAHKVQPETFLARKGQALIWAANLLHGGSPQLDPRRTRWSQVTHYYFSDCLYYTPAFSDEPMGRLDLRKIVNVATNEIEPNKFLGETVPHHSSRQSPESGLGSKRGFFSRWKSRSGGLDDQLPKDFDAAQYYSLNPDVLAAGEDAGEHYIKHGQFEGRPFR